MTESDEIDYPVCITATVLGGQIPLTGTYCGTATEIITHIIKTNPPPTITTIITPITITTHITHTPTDTGTPPTSGPFAAGPTPSATPPVLPTGAIVGIGFGALFFLALVALLAMFLWRKSRTPPAPPALPAPMMSPGPPGYPPYAELGGGVGYNYGQGQGPGQGQQKHSPGTPIYGVPAQ